MSDRGFDNWLKAYLLYTAHTLPPDSFHLWTAISVVASALQRKVYIPVSLGYNCYPNDYIVLIGPPGTMKSTAMRIGREILSKVPGMEKRISTDSITREKLIQVITQASADGHSSYTIHSTELATLFTSSKMDMMVFLTDIYDSPLEWSHATKLGGTDKIKAPCLNMLAATTPDSMKKEIPIETAGIGLTSRIVFIYENHPRIRSWRQEFRPELEDMRKILIGDLTHIASLKGKFTIEPDADSFYDEWFQGQLQQQNPTSDPALNPYFARKHTHVLKISMVIAAAQRDELVITLDDFKQAFSMLHNLEQTMGKIFLGVGSNIFAPTMEGVFTFLCERASASAPMPYQQLLKTFQRDVRMDEMNEILDTLIGIGSIKKVSHNNTPHYYAVN